MGRLVLRARRPAAGALLLLLVLASGTPPARGQIPTFEGEEVVVPGLRPQHSATTPAYVTVLSGEELRRLGFLTLADALTLLAEVTVRAAGGGPMSLFQPSVRGSTPQQVHVLLDGVPLGATAQFGVSLGTITLAEVDRIEVVRGPYAALHSGFAVISVTTRRDLRPAVEGMAASHGTTQAVLRLGGASGAGMVRVGVERLATDGYRPNGDGTRWTGVARWERDAGAGRLALAVHHSAGEAGLPGTTAFPTPSDRLRDARTAAALSWTREGPDGHRLGRVWWLGQGLDFTSPGFASTSWGQAWGGTWQAAQVQGAGALGWGVEWQQAAFAYRDTFSAFDARTTAAALYGQLDRMLGDRTLAGMGLRLEHHSAYGLQVNPRLGFVHFLSPGVRLRGGVGRTSRAPTMGELFFPGCSNPDLRPEQAWAADLGMEVVLRPGALLRVNTFYTDAQDLIVGGCPPQNVGSARIAGASADLLLRAVGPWSGTLTLTWTDAVDRTTGQALLRQPAWQAALALRFAVAPATTLGLVAAYVGARPDLDFSTFPATRVTLPPYLTVGLRAEHVVGDVVWRAGVDNLFDARYEPLAGFPAPGRTLYLQVGGRF